MSPLSNQTGPSLPFSRCWAEVDLLNLERNLTTIRNALPAHLTYVAVVKADAYGHGLGPTVSRLLQSGAGMFGVANLEEARQVLEIGSGWPILILSPLLPEEYSGLFEGPFIPCISNEREMAALQERCQQRRQTLDIHLKIDTGLGRVGVWYEEAAELISKLPQYPMLRLKGCYTHFSDPVKNPDFTALQRKRLMQSIPEEGKGQLMIHADNSSGLETFRPDSLFNAVRIGLLQFGVVPYPDSLFGGVRVLPVLSFFTRLSLIKRVPSGVGLSYGQTHRLHQATRIGLLTAGYADGIPLSISDRGEVLIRGRRCPILGRITMDQTIVSLENVPDAEVGDLVTLIGRNGDDAITLAEFSDSAGTIPWEVLTGLSKRVKRIYRGGRV